MKKLLAIIIASIIMLSLCACANEPAPNGQATDSPTESAADEEAAAGLDEQEEQGVPAPALDGYYVSGGEEGDYAESGEYAVDITGFDPEAMTGNVTIYHNGEESAVGTFYTEQLWFLGHGALYKLYVTGEVTGADFGFEDINMLDYPNDADREECLVLSVKPSNLPDIPEGEPYASDFTVHLYRQN